jgi:hypothetical protein
MGKGMDCPMQLGRGDVLIDYCAGRLSARTRPVLRQHAAACVECARFIEDQRRAWNALDDWEDCAVSPDFNRRLFARIEAAERARRDRVRRWTPLTITAAAAMLAILYLSIAPRFSSENPSGGEQAGIERIDFDKVEQTLDDMRMLRQLGLAAPEGDQHSSM